MPYSKAHYYLLGLLAITVLAFWDSYFGKLNEAPMAHHWHGITSTLWILLLATQNGLIHHHHRHLHRLFGLSLFVLVPLMTAAFAMVSWVGAQKAVGGHPFYVQFGQALLTADLLLLLTTPLQIYLALKLRRQVRLHSALMLGTVIGLLPPILSRLLVNWVPAWQITGLDTMHHFAYGLNISMVMGLLISLLLFYCYRKEGWPWLLAALITLMMYVLYATLGQSDWWAEVVGLIAGLSVIAVFVFGLLLGLLACVLGWIHGAAKPHNG